MRQFFNSPEKVNLAPVWNLDGLVSDEKRDRIVVNNSYVVEIKNKVNCTLDSGVANTIAVLQNTHQLSLNAVARLVWHKVLGVFGFTRQTVTLFNTVQTGKVYWQRDFFDHDEVVDVEFSTIIEQLQQQPAQEQTGLPCNGVLSVNASLQEDLVSHAPLWAEVNTKACGGIDWDLHFDEAIMSRDRAEAMLELVVVIFEQLAAHPNITEAQLVLINRRTKQELLLWNNTDGEFPSDKCLHQLFEAAVERTPKATAVVYGDINLDYQSLNGKANQIGRYILEQQPDADSRQLIALMLNKNEYLIMALLGVWKAGAAYVPIDSGFPDERIRFILEDSGVNKVLANQEYKQRLTKLGGESLQVIGLESMFDDLDELNYSEKNFDLGLTSTVPAYMTYTSGTTGVPKGVLKNNRSVVNSITYLTQHYEIGKHQNEAVALFSPYGFEPFTRQMLIALINSQKLVIVDEEEKLDAIRFPQFLKRHGITYLNGTASVLQQYDYSDCPELKRILLVGEELTPSRYERMRKVFNETLINEYAFTEAAFVTATKFFELDSVRDSRSIGRPVRNVKCYVLNQHLQQVPPGTTGELFIGGAGVANGYFNRDELTAERFIPNPHRSEDEVAQGLNERLYRTGDLARVTADGEFEFLGRNDFQIKLNGIRVEPGEIESIAVQHLGIQSCVVAVRDSAEGTGNEAKHLVGYYVVKSASVSEEKLVEHLALQLPRFMMPARMVQVDKIPVNTNGKVDLHALPDIKELSRDNKVVTCRNTTDQELQAIWSEALGLTILNIGIKDDFFYLGGSSITGIILIAQIRKKFKVSLTIEDVFLLRTIEKLTDKISELQANGYLVDNSVPNIAAFDGREGVYLANSLQQGFMYQYLKKQEQGTNDDYVMQSLLTYRADISVEHFKAAWELMQSRYGVLRTRFEWKGEPLQIIQPEQELSWQLLDFTGHADSQQAILELQEQDAKKSYKLDSEAPFRVYLIKQSKQCYSCLFSCHHIVLDGWSLAILFHRFHSAYLALSFDNKLNLEIDNTYEQALTFLQQNRNEHSDYWQQQIDNITERGDYNGLVKQEKRYNVSLTEYDHVQSQKAGELLLDKHLADKVRSICANNGVTLHSLLQFVWHKVLHSVGNGEQTVVGTIVSGRNLPIENIEYAVGLFINTLPLIVDHNAVQKKSTIEVINDIQLKVNAMNSYSNVELGSVFKGNMKKGLFDTLFVLENYPDLGAESLKEHGIDFEASYELEKVDYPLAVIARESELGTINFTLWYAEELFEQQTIDMLLGMVNLICTQLVDDIAKPVKDYNVVDQNQVRMLDELNRTRTAFAETQTLHGRFECMADKYPDRLALVYEQTRLTYQQLNIRANLLAHKLREILNIYPDKYIALVLDKNEHMFSSIFGVWKSGAAYVPIDPAFPKDRIQFILGDIQTQLLITNRRYLEAMRDLVDDGVEILVIDDLCLDEMPRTNPEPISSATDLAYTMYTSGTTGRPKGVMVEHRGVLNLQMSLADIFDLHADHQESFLSFSNYIFDHFVEQMTDALLNGQKLVVLNDEMRADKARLYQYIRENEVTYLSGTPSVLSMYEFDSLQSLTRIDAIGEDFTETLFNKIRATFKGLIINGYGPTEVSITTHKRPYQLDQPRQDKSIGFPMGNCTTYILDENMKRLPQGCIGELYLGGVGVARGYLNREELSAERFVANPFSNDCEVHPVQNDRIYKTGDLARWLPNGEVEYLGRTDTQVKIRGLRIELAEIEAALTACPDVKQAVVIARNRQVQGDVTPHKYLVGFYLSELNLSAHKVTEFLRSKLPDFMVPNQVMRIDSVPVTPSGKLDVRRLPETSFLTQGETYVAPSNEIEHQLCASWSEILGIPADKIGINDSFFALGGDSIMATRLAYTITETMGKSLSVANVFEANTIALQSKWLMQPSEDSHEIVTRLPNDSNPVSFAQERLLFIEQFENGTSAYNINIHMELPRTVEQTALIQALQAVVIRHGMLRTLIDGEHKGIRLQRTVTKKQAMDLLQIKQVEFVTREEMDSALMDEERHVFALDRELPIRIALTCCDEDSESLYLTMVVHHTCFDGWSWLVLQRDLNVLFANYNQRNSWAQLPKLTLNYAEFATWQRETLSGEKLNKLNDYWLSKLNDYEPLHLQSDFPRPVQFDYQGKAVDFSIDKQQTDDLRALAQQLDISFYSVLVGAYCLMLSHYTNQRDIIIGIPFANRSRNEFKDMVGFFANLLVLRIHVDPELSLTDYLKSVSREIIGTQMHQEMPFEQLVKSLGIENDPSQHPIIQVIFALDLLEGSSELGREQLDALQMRRYKPDSGGHTTAKYDLSGWVSETDSGLHGNFTYATSLFTEQTVSDFTCHYSMMLEHIASMTMNREAMVAGVPRVSESEKLQLLALDTACHDYGVQGELCLHQLFEQAVQETPDKTALVFEQLELSFVEVNNRANRLAHYLRSEHKIQPGQLVALMLDKSEWTVISILAVLKVGAAYVPIDPNYPHQRIKFILADTQASIVLTNSDYQEKLAGEQNEVVIAIDTDTVIKQLAQMPTGSCGVNVDKDDLAYIIYTSGTTGEPKGVQIAHASVVNLCNDLRVRYFSPDSEHTVLLLANYVFDFSVEQMLVSIFSGHKLIIYSDQQAVDTFYQQVNDHQLSFLSGTPTHIQQFDLSRFKHLRTLLVAGEAFTENHHRKIRQQYKGILINAYGVTETTVYNTVKLFDANDVYQNSLGKPLNNTKAYVLDNRLQLLPKGAVGELYLAGDCVGVGYLNRSELTESRFIDNPYRSESEKQANLYPKLYKTGDLVRYLPNGELSYFGRNDQQVKIRGLRVELGEVESVLAAFSGIEQCAVNCVRKEDGSEFLVGFYYCTDGSVIEGQVMEHLKSKLPAFAVPQQLVRLTNVIPMTVNGKVDFSALPEVKLELQSQEIASARNALEQTLLTIWQEQLGTESLGIDHDFFKTGGDSISAMTLVSSIQRELSQFIRVKDIFDYPTIRSLYDNVLKNRKLLCDCIAEQGKLEGSLPMLPIQQWFFAKDLHNRNVWNQSFGIRTLALDLNKLEKAISGLVAHHDILRLRFGHNELGWYQYYDGNLSPIPLRTLDVSELTEQQINEQLSEWQNEFDIQNASTYCFAYLHGFANGHAAVWFTAHHLIIDTVSWRILINDLQRLYDGGNLGAKSSSYRQWALAIEQHQISSEEVNHWSEVVGAIADLPPQKAVQIAPIQKKFELDAVRSKALLVDCNLAYDTKINDLLLSALGMALKEVNGCGEHYVLLEAHGREDIASELDINSTMGWFTAMYPFTIHSKAEIPASVLAVKDTRRAIPNHGIGYGAHCGYVEHRLPDISFNYLGRFNEESKNGGLWGLDRSLCDNLRDARDVNSSECLTDITVACHNDVFSVSVDSQLDSNWLEEFTEAYKRNLEILIDHTRSETYSHQAMTQLTGVQPLVGRFDPYVEFNQSITGGPVLFILPPGEGGAESYFNNLAKHLTDYRLVVFNNFYLHSKLPDTTFESLAQFYLEYVQTIAPHGPYHFLGWSFGGVLSMEMSRLLVEAGEKIGSLHCIDSYFNVRKACCAQGLGEEQVVIDIVNYRYDPSRQSMENLVAATDQLVLFKAMTMNESYDNEKQRLLYQYYHESKWNNLETLIDIEQIDLQPLQGESHVSWVENQDLLRQMTKVINANVFSDVKTS